MFEAKRDKFFTVYIIKVFVTITLFLIFPFIFAPEITHNLTFLIIWSSLYLYFLTTAVLTALNVKYIFQANHLHAKGGPFSKKVPYSAIYKVSTTPDVYYGDMLLTSGIALEIFYINGKKAKSVKISPKDQDTFVDQLKFHSPQAKLDIIDLDYNQV